MAFKDMGKEYLAYKRRQAVLRIVRPIAFWVLTTAAVYVIISVIFIQR